MHKHTATNAINPRMELYLYLGEAHLLYVVAYLRCVPLNPLHQRISRSTLYQPQEQTTITSKSVSGLVVKSIVAIDGPRVRFAADARKYPRASLELFFFRFMLSTSFLIAPSAMQCFIVIKIQDRCIVCPSMLPTARVRLIFARQHETEVAAAVTRRCSFPPSKRGPVY